MSSPGASTVRRAVLAVSTVGALLALAAVVACAPPKPTEAKVVPIPEGTYDPAVWGEEYPVQYERWLATRDERPEGLSPYKRGYDAGRTFDKLSEFPFMALLFNGWGFGIEYNEPRGHYYMLSDQLEVDPARVKAGGACLTCKTPYADPLAREHGAEGYFAAPYLEAVQLIPEEHKELGAACIDCHDEQSLELEVKRWTMQTGLKALGKEPKGRELRIAVCGQCHCTYSVMKDAEGRSVDVRFPWEGAEWGDISVERIIANLLAKPPRNEWTQSVTGYKMAFIRHPEFEMFTRDSVHFKGGATCPDCHGPYLAKDGVKSTDHNFMSPLKNDLRGCRRCHVESAAELKEQVVVLQDRYVSSLLRAGYAAATCAKLIETVHGEQARGARVDSATYESAKEAYLQAFYRVVFLGAENSVGFHNPSEGGRIAADAVAYAGRCEALLRQLLWQVGVRVPEEVNLELRSYLDARGEKPLNFDPEVLFADPFGTTEEFVGGSLRALVE